MPLALAGRGARGRAPLRVRPVGRPLPGGTSSFPLPCPPQPALLSPPLSRLLFPLTTLLPQAASALPGPQLRSVTENRALDHVETPPPVVPPGMHPFPPLGSHFSFFWSVSPSEGQPSARLFALLSLRVRLFPSSVYTPDSTTSLLLPFPSLPPVAASSCPKHLPVYSFSISFGCHLSFGWWPRSYRKSM